MMDGRSVLARRVEELDARSALPWCVSVMRSSTGDERVAPCVAAAEADGIIGRSRSLHQLTADAPEIVVGPLRLDAQYWIGTDKHRPDVELAPRETAFVRVSDATTKTPSTKPFGLGLFTSTGAVLSPHGMWRLYLDACVIERHVWVLEVNGRPVVREIRSAAEWVEFVLSYPRREGELLFPDWIAVASHCDAIHMTLRAIVAVQGLCFPTENGTVAPTYWDVESTFWLRWCFGAARLVEVVEADRDLAPTGHATPLVPRYLSEPTIARIEAVVLAPGDLPPREGT